MAKPPVLPAVRSKEKERKQSDQPAARSSLFPYLSGVVQHPRFALILAAAYGIILLIVGLSYHVVGDYNVETDFFWSYVPEAKRIVHGIVTIDGFRGPAYPILLALVAAAVRNYFTAGVVLSTISAAAALGLTFALLKRLIGADKAFFVSGIMALNGIFVQYTYTAGTDMVFNAVMTLCVYVFLRREERRYRDIVIAGLLAGAAYLMRYNGIAAVIAFLVGILVINQFRLGWSERAKTAAVFLGAFFIVILPYGLYCLAQKGSFFYTENYLNIAREMYRDRFTHDEFWITEAPKYHSTAQVILGNPELFVKMIVRNIYEHFVGDMDVLLGWHVGVLVLPGLLLVWRERANRRLMTFFLLFVGLFGILLLLLQQVRYSLFLLPGYLVLAVLALSWKGLYSFRFWNRIHLGGLIAVGVLMWTFSVSYKFNRNNIDSGPKEIPVIASWFNGNFGESERGKIIMTRKPHIAYYLDMEMTVFPMVTTEAELRQEVEKTHASYLFFSVMEAGLRPQFQHLLDPRRAPAWLIPLTYTVAPPAVLYKTDLTKSP